MGVGRTGSQFSAFQDKFMPIYGSDGKGGQAVQGMAASMNPFNQAFGNSFNTMQNLGSNIGSQFGAINAANQGASLANKGMQLDYQKARIPQQMQNDRISALLPLLNRMADGMRSGSFGTGSTPGTGSGDPWGGAGPGFGGPMMRGYTTNFGQSARLA